MQHFDSHSFVSEYGKGYVLFLRGNFAFQIYICTAIWYHLCNNKKRENTHEVVLLAKA